MFNHITVQEKIQNWNVEIGRKHQNQTDTDTPPAQEPCSQATGGGQALPGVNNLSAASPSPGDRGIALKPRARAASGWAGADTELSREGGMHAPGGPSEVGGGGREGPGFQESVFALSLG